MHPVEFLNLAIPEILNAFEKRVIEDTLDTIPFAQDAVEVMGRFTLFKRLSCNENLTRGDIMFAVQNVSDEPIQFGQNELSPGELYWLQNGIPILTFGNKTPLEYESTPGLLFYHAYVGGFPNGDTTEQGPVLDIKPRVF